MEQEKKQFDIKSLIEKGKAKGSLSNSEINEVLEFFDYDIDQIDKIYDQLEANGIEVGYSNSRTCEIGLATNSGVPYRSIIYLVNECTKSK